jgi:hypothetical protein
MIDKDALVMIDKDALVTAVAAMREISPLLNWAHACRTCCISSFISTSSEIHMNHSSSTLQM